MCAHLFIVCVHLFIVFPFMCVYCVSIYTHVSIVIQGAHVTINARNEDDVDSDTILDKVAKASG